MEATCHDRPACPFPGSRWAATTTPSSGRARCGARTCGSCRRRASGSSPECDVVSQDHYLDHRLAHPHAEQAFADDLTRGVAGGSWLLMESATSAVNWQPVNIAKRPGELLMDSLRHVARGADGVGFFQWRASRAGRSSTPRSCRTPDRTRP